MFTLSLVCHEVLAIGLSLLCWLLMKLPVILVSCAFMPGQLGREAQATADTELQEMSKGQRKGTNGNQSPGTSTNQSGLAWPPQDIGWVITHHTEGEGPVTLSLTMVKPSEA